MGKYIQDLGRVARGNLRAILTGTYKEGKTDLNTLGDLALLRLDRKTATPSLKGVPKLTKSQKRAVRRFYDPYIRRVTDRYHRLYTWESGGRFCPGYLPEDLFFMDVDRYFSDREEARYLDNKCYYYRLFSNVKQPEPVAMRVGKIWLDGCLHPAAPGKILELLKKEPEVVVKRATGSEGGFGVDFLEGKNLCADFIKLMKTLSCDVVVQRPVRQHPQMAAFHKESVNTLRVVSLLARDKVKIYGVILRIGVGKDRVDNSSRGGVICGVKRDGSLGQIGVLHNGKVLRRHPDGGYLFSEKRVPCLDKVCRLVREAHGFLGHFRLVAWDVAVDENGEAVLIEANLSLGGINDLQVCTGPLFRKDTEKILREVYRGRRRKWTTLF